ncbi:alpha/beta fold hydrolase [Magnetospirillum sp. UT-4]|uniref:alpha/beta fold hydrolase n=1 Tax=Magnetospirillum sp. UT-4 TaxID=2681467 RepID=UPI001384255F|nr:alpha/beta fold hydrolase [Magnetospirillum sp. UT-4]CAA7626518.1 putative Carboxylesterase BioH [Magnetospirillum sp. UT-4]
MRTLVLVHGWGFDAGFWQPVAQRLPDFERVFVDLGFRGEARIPDSLDQPLVVGHSMGFPWALAHLPRPWAGAMAINSFARFLRAPDFVAGVPPVKLQRMIDKFGTEPHAVTADFLSRIGVEAPEVEDIRPEPLARALDWLAACDQRAALAGLDCPLQAVAGTHDQLVPEAMSRVSFPPQALVLAEGGGHLLPQTHPEWVASRIRLFAASLR